MASLSELIDVLRPVWDTEEQYNTPEMLGNLASGVGETVSGLGEMASHLATNPTQIGPTLSQIPGAIKQDLQQRYSGDVAGQAYEDPASYLFDVADVLGLGAGVARGARAAAPHVAQGARAVGRGAHPVLANEMGSIVPGAELGKKGRLASAYYEDYGGAQEPRLTSMPSDVAESILNDLEALDDLIEEARIGAQQGRVDPADLAELEAQRVSLEGQLSGSAGTATQGLLNRGMSPNPRPAPATGGGAEMEMGFGPHPNDVPDVLPDEPPPWGSTVAEPLPWSPQQRAGYWQDEVADLPPKPTELPEAMRVMESRLQQKAAHGNLAPSNMSAKGRYYPGDVENAGTRLSDMHVKLDREANFSDVIAERAQLQDRLNYLQGKARTGQTEFDWRGRPSDLDPMVMDEMSEVARRIDEINQSLPMPSRSPVSVGSDPYAAMENAFADLRPRPETGWDLADDYDKFTAKYRTKAWEDRPQYERDVIKEGARMKRARRLGREDVTPPRRRRGGTETVHRTSQPDTAADTATSPASTSDFPNTVISPKGRVGEQAAEGTITPRATTSDLDVAAEALRKVGFDDEQIDVLLKRTPAQADIPAPTSSTSAKPKTAQTTSRRRGSTSTVPSTGKLTSARKALRGELGRNPSAKEIAEKLNVESKSAIREIRAWLKEQPRNIS